MSELDKEFIKKRLEENRKKEENKKVDVNKKISDVEIPSEIKDEDSQEENSTDEEDEEDEEDDSLLDTSEEEEVNGESNISSKLNKNALSVSSDSSSDSIKEEINALNKEVEDMRSLIKERDESESVFNVFADDRRFRLFLIQTLERIATSLEKLSKDESN